MPDMWDYKLKMYTQAIREAAEKPAYYPADEARKAGYTWKDKFPFGKGYDLYDKDGNFIGNFGNMSLMLRKIGYL